MTSRHFYHVFKAISCLFLPNHFGGEIFILLLKVVSRNWRGQGKIHAESRKTPSSKKKEETAYSRRAVLIFCFCMSRVHMRNWRNQLEPEHTHLELALWISYRYGYRYV